MWENEIQSVLIILLENLVNSSNNDIEKLQRNKKIR